MKGDGKTNDKGFAQLGSGTHSSTIDEKQETKKKVRP